MKKCIISLIDHNHAYRVNELIKNLNDNFVDANNDVDLLLFHESQFPIGEIKEKYRGVTFYHQIELYDVPSSFLQNAPISCYGSGIGYRLMCRFFSGIVYKLLKQYNYDYALRLDTDSRFLDRLNRNIFDEFMQNNGSYGYINIQNDRIEVRVELLKEVIEYIQNHQLKTKISINDTLLHQYNLVYYNNFEMIKISEFTDDKYLKYFDYLDSKNGFLRYRWGDHAVKFLYTQLFFDQSNIHYFKDLSYFHHELYKNRPFILRDLRFNV